MIERPCYMCEGTGSRNGLPAYNKLSEFEECPYCNGTGIELLDEEYWDEQSY